MLHVGLLLALLASFGYCNIDNNANCMNNSTENPQLGVISDCKCNFQSVHEAVNSFFAPLLLDITSR